MPPSHNPEVQITVPSRTTGLGYQDPEVRSEPKSVFHDLNQGIAFHRFDCMDNWQRISEDENPHYGKRLFTFPLGDETYRVSIDEADPYSIFVKYQSKSWTWPIEIIERSSDKFRIAGLTWDEQPILSETCWFELQCDESPKITYWGNQVIIRVDLSI